MLETMTVVYDIHCNCRRIQYDAQEVNEGSSNNEVE